MPPDEDEVIENQDLNEDEDGDEIVDPEEAAAFAAAFESTVEQTRPESEREETIGDEPEGDEDDAAGGIMDREDEPEPPKKAPVEASADEGDEDPDDDIRKQLQNITSRLRKTEGHLGVLQDELKQARESASQRALDAGGDAPTARQVSAALGSTEQFKVLQAEFPEFAEAWVAEMQAIGMGGGAAPAIDTDTLIAQARDEGRQAAIDEFIDLQHEGWVDTVRTDSFRAWLEEQDEKILNKAASSRARDTIDVLDKYAEFSEFVEGMGTDAQRYTTSALLAMYKENGLDSPPSTKPEVKRQAQQRLQGAVPATRPRGGTTPSKQTASAEDAFTAGFNSVRGKG